MYVVFSIVVILRLFGFFIFGPHPIDGETITIRTTLLSDVTKSSNSASVSVLYSNIWGSVPILITLPRFDSVGYGDLIVISGKISVKTSDTGRITRSMVYPKIERMPSSNPILTVSKQLRDGLIGFYTKILPASSAGLLIGIVLGVKTSVSASLQQSLQSTGTTHIIAASGMNVTLVAGVLISVLGRLFRRQIGIGIALGVVLWYVLISGVQPSILRAGLMIVLSFGAQLFGRQHQAWYGLFLVGGIMLLLQPHLIADLGFQLSMLSTIGIIYFQPMLAKLPMITEDITTSLSAQLTTTPILILAFGKYGILSLLVNGLILWMVTPIMIIGGVGGLVGLGIPIVGKVIVWAVLPFLLLMEATISSIGSLGWVISIPAEAMLVYIGVYFVLISTIVFIKIKSHI